MTSSHYPWDDSQGATEPTWQPVANADTTDTGGGQSGGDAFAIVPINDFSAQHIGPSGPVTAATGLPTNEALYIQQPGNANAISLTDINQGQIGDCFLLSSIGEIALNDPSFIQNMIHQNANGTETVTLDAPHRSGWTTVLTPTAVTVTNSFPTYGVNGAGQDVVNGVSEIWPQVLESAYASANGGYPGINQGGSPVIAMEELTGQRATWTTNVSGITAAELTGYQSAKDLVVMDTFSSTSQYLSDGLVADHAYMFEGVVQTAKGAAVELANPWGAQYDPPPILLSQLSGGIVEVDIGKA
jgi:hypothetical protein